MRTAPRPKRSQNFRSAGSYPTLTRAATVGHGLTCSIDVAMAIMSGSLMLCVSVLLSQ